MAPSKRRSVKSDATDAHERAKDYLAPHEMSVCSKPLNRGAMAFATTCCCS